MKALSWNGTRLELVERPAPTIDADGALIQVLLAGVCGTDREIFRGYAGFRGIPGHEFVGRVVECSQSEWVGQRVVVDINVSCGQCDRCRSGLDKHCRNRQVIGLRGRDGAFAEYIVAPVRNLYRVPDEVADEEAVFAEPLAAAFRIPDHVTFTCATRCAILGDGRLAFLTAQVLRTIGVIPIVVGHHARKLTLFAAFGLQALLETDLQPADGEAMGDCDVVIDCTGSRHALNAALRLVRPQGCVVLKSTCAGDAAVNVSQVVVDEITIIGSRCGPVDVALKALANREVQVGCLIDRVYPLTDGLNAIRHAMQPETRKVLLKML